MADHLRDELVADVREGVAVRAGHVVDRAVAHVFNAPVTPAEPWSFSTGMADDLVDGLGDQLAEVRAVLPVVAGSSP